VWPKKLKWWSVLAVVAALAAACALAYFNEVVLRGGL